LKEEWKPLLKGMKDYMKFNMGRVKSLHYGKERIMKTPDNYKGYKFVDFSKQTTKAKQVHRLVAEAFIPNPMNLPVVNHLDGDKHNNCASNLEWCTAKENTNHAIKNKLLVQNTKKIAEEKRKKVIQYDLL